MRNLSNSVCLYWKKRETKSEGNNIALAFTFTYLLWFMPDPDRG